MVIAKVLAIATAGAALAAPYSYTPLGMCRYSYDTQQWERTVSACTLVVSLAYGPGEKAFAYGARAEAQTELWSFEEAVADAQTALKLDPKTPSAHFVYARVSHTFGKFKEAGREIEAAIQLAPRSARYRLEQAAILLEMSQNGKARQAFDEAIRIDPSFSDAYFDRAKFRQALGDDDGAIADYAQSVRLSSHDQERWLRFNMATMPAGRASPALVAINAAVAAQPKDLMLHAIRGKMLMDHEDYSRAIGDFDVVLAKASKWVDVKVSRIYALTRRAYRDTNVADAERAVAEGREAVVMCPHTCTYHALALAHRALGDLGVEPQVNYAAAVDAIEHALRLMPRRLPYRMLKAQLLEQRQAMREAIVAYKEALDQARNSNDTVSGELIEAALHRAERAVARN